MTVSFLLAKLRAYGFIDATIGIMLEFQMRLQANGKKYLEDAPRLKFSRKTQSTILTKAASRCMHMTIKCMLLVRRWKRWKGP